VDCRQRRLNFAGPASKRTSEPAKMRDACSATFAPNARSTTLLRNARRPPNYNSISGQGYPAPFRRRGVRCRRSPSCTSPQRLCWNLVSRLAPQFLSALCAQFASRSEVSPCTTRSLRKLMDCSTQFFDCALSVMCVRPPRQAHTAIYLVHPGRLPRLSVDFMSLLPRILIKSFTLWRKSEATVCLSYLHQRQGFHVLPTPS